ncbi:MAG: 7,8-dihydropterin-6-yl-methyl-4-(beta-D-ribofuranosyl)aminobenzene 5-phosphate synthase, partial [Mycobacterium sp.]|nr:7,8-dihydropterin-6-yl-methyl-4-(beta-D-ribofuranosyl)aminobenzene 5-phosphate synthase [Mycobacterium sp.]
EPTITIVIDNATAERLAVDLSSIDVLFLSHWHWDHSGGISAVVAAIAAARGSAGRTPLVVDVHPDRPDQRGILTPFGMFAMLPPEPTIDAIEAAGGRVVHHAGVHEVGGLFLASGDIPRQTSYETGLEGHHTWRGDQVTLDPEIHDERFLAATVRGRGTTVLTACSHAGIVNVGFEARRLLPDQPVDLLLGGYHLAGATVEDRIEPTVRDLKELVGPGIVAPGHCTGWRAAAALANAFSPPAALRAWWAPATCSALPEPGRLQQVRGPSVGRARMTVGFSTRRPLTLTLGRTHTSALVGARCPRPAIDEPRLPDDVGHPPTATDVHLGARPTTDERLRHLPTPPKCGSSDVSVGG